MAEFEKIRACTVGCPSDSIPVPSSPLLRAPRRAPAGLPLARARKAWASVAEPISKNGRSLLSGCAYSGTTDGSLNRMAQTLS